MTTAERIARLTASTATADESLRKHALGTTTVSQLVQVGRVRDDAQRIASDARAVQSSELLRELDAGALDLAQQGAGALLEQAGLTWGLSWIALARMVGVSDTAVRKWRRGDTVSVENLRQLARAIAFLRLIREQQWMADPAAWLEMRLAESATLAPIDLYPTHPELLFDLATHRLQPHEALDEFDAEWRTRYAVDRRVETQWTDDGPVLRLRTDSR